MISAGIFVGNKLIFFIFTLQNDIELDGEKNIFKQLFDHEHE